MTQEENKQFIKRFMNEVLNKKNLDALNDYVADNFVEEVPMPDQKPGREGLKYALNMMFKAYPDIYWTIDEQYAEGDYVITRFTWTGTHKGEFMGYAATGKQVKTWGVVIDVIKGGKLTRSWLLADRLGLMQQIGAIPTTARAAQHWK